MLENMNDEDRFKTTYNICNDVLKGVAEGSVKLEGRSGFCLVRVSFLDGNLYELWVCLSHP